MRVLAIPAVDRTIAIVASLPFVYALYQRLAAGTLNIPRASAAIGLLVVIVTMVIRRAPQRVTPNPLWWLLAFVATYGPLAWSAFAPQGRPIVPNIITNVLAIVGLAIVVYARVSLGRNIGFVPAQRQIVTSGAYRYVRHPIYTGLFLVWAVLVLRLYSGVNVALLLTFYVLIVIKCLVEEAFLRHDPEYEQYMQRVRYRFIPGLV
jgi:protein-S-isoprenylcysteine O-methyltransferase Ste14